VNSQFLRQDAAVNADFDIFTETVDYLVYTAVATRAPTVITAHTETTVGLTELTEVAEADATWGLRQSTYSYDTDAIEDLNLIIRLVGSAPVSCWISSLVLRYPNGEPGSERSSPAVGVTPAPWPEVHYSFGSAIIDGPTCCTNPAQFTLSLGTVGPDDDGGADGGWGGDPDPESLLPKLPAISLDDNYNGAVLLFVHTGWSPGIPCGGDEHTAECTAQFNPLGLNGQPAITMNRIQAFTEAEHGNQYNNFEVFELTTDMWIAAGGTQLPFLGDVQLSYNKQPVGQVIWWAETWHSYKWWQEFKFDMGEDWNSTYLAWQMQEPLNEQTVSWINYSIHPGQPSARFRDILVNGNIITGDNYQDWLQYTRSFGFIHYASTNYCPLHNSITWPWRITPEGLELWGTEGGGGPQGWYTTYCNFNPTPASGAAILWKNLKGFGIVATVTPSSSTSTAETSTSTAPQTSTSTRPDSTSTSTAVDTTSTSTAPQTSTSTAPQTSTSTAPVSSTSTEYDAATTFGDIFIDYYNSSTDTWTHGTKIMQGIDVTKQMDVAVWGRLVYVFLEGRDPALFYLRDDTPDADTPTWVEVVIGLTSDGPFPGPGPRPQIDDLVVRGAHPAVPLAAIPPNEAPLYTRLWVRRDDEIRDFGQDIASSDEPWSTTTSDWVDVSQYNFYLPHQVFILENFGQHRLEAGKYNVMSFLYDTRTGRKSQPSVIEGTVPYDFDQGATEQDCYLYLEGIWDTDLYNQLWVYRSVKAEEGQGIQGVNQLWLDGIADMADIQTSTGGVTSPYKHFFYPLRLNDVQLPLQSPYISLTLFDEGMPKGGAAEMYNNMMLVGKTAGLSTGAVVDEANTGLGEIRSELFPPGNRYVPTVPSNEVITFDTVGDNVIGFARDRLYHIRKEGQYVNIEEMHEGYGVTGHRASSPLGSASMFVNHRGIKQVGSNGKLDDIRAIDDMVIRQWGPTVQDVSTAFDPVGGALFVLNPAFEEAACFWVNTGMVSQIQDLPFSGVRTGVWPINPTKYDDTLVSRALWLQPAPNNPTIADAHEFKPRLYVTDIYREKVVTGSSEGGANGRPRLRLMDVNMNARGRLLGAVSAGDTNLRVRGEAFDAHGMVGARVYTSNSAAKYKGVSVRIVNVVLAAGNIDGVMFSELAMHPDDAHLFAGLEIDDYVIISPVVVKATAAPLRMEVGGQGFSSMYDFVTVRQIETLGIALSDVSGYLVDVASAQAKWEGALYEGNEDEPSQLVAPKGRDDVDIFSMEEGESNRYAVFGQWGKGGSTVAPGVRIAVPDVDYRLLGMNVTGTIRASVKSKYAP
jgi:hypothetical protein